MNHEGDADGIPFIRRLFCATFPQDGAPTAGREPSGRAMPNAFSSLVGIDIPIVQAAMGGATSPQFAAAVSNAGGLGMLALGWSPPDAIRAEIRATKARTDRPFGVNLVLSQSQEERLAICLGEGVPIVSFFWGQAGPLTAAAHRGGAKVLHTAASADAAKVSVDDGADVIVAQGWEAAVTSTGPLQRWRSFRRLSTASRRSPFLPPVA